MKKALTIALALLVVVLVAKNHQQKEIINSIHQQRTMTAEQFDSLMERIEQDHPNYVLDVLCESDEYQSIIETL